MLSDVLCRCLLQYEVHFLKDDQWNLSGGGGGGGGKKGGERERRGWREREGGRKGGRGGREGEREGGRERGEFVKGVDASFDRLL